MKNKAPFGHTPLTEIPSGSDRVCGHLGSFCMKEIPLTGGGIALVDDDDYAYINQWKWHICTKQNYNTYYARRAKFMGRDSGGKRIVKTVWMHREIMNAPDGYTVDHINHNGFDNRKSNMRLCTQRVNCQNRTDKSKSGYPCVYGYGKSGKFYSKTEINGQRKYIGSFDTAKEAFDAYIRKVR